MNLPMLPHDKANHLIYGILIYLVCYPFVGALIAASIGVVAAVGKEVYDWYHRTSHTPDWKDAAATIIGVIIAVLLTFL